MRRCRHSPGIRRPGPRGPASSGRATLFAPGPPLKATPARSGLPAGSAVGALVGLTAAGLLVAMPVAPVPLSPGVTAPVLLGVAAGGEGESDGEGVDGGVLLGEAGVLGDVEPAPGVAVGAALDGDAVGVGVADGADGDGVGAGHVRAGPGGEA